MRGRSSRGFTLVEVLVALVIVAMGLAALMSAVSGAARTSGYLRDKTLAQWIALNRLSEVRLTVNKLGPAIPTTGASSLGSGSASSGSTGSTGSTSSFSQNGDTGQLDFANRTWHYDTRYFDTSFPSMKRVVVRVWAGDAKTKGNPLAESTGFLGASLGTPGNSNVDWTTGSTMQTAQPCSTTPTNQTTSTTPPCAPPSGGSIIPTTPGTVGTTGTSPTPQ
jgi:general secretion pathway protein I